MPVSLAMLFWGAVLVACAVALFVVMWAKVLFAAGSILVLCGEPGLDSAMLVLGVFLSTTGTIGAAGRALGSSEINPDEVMIYLSAGATFWLLGLLLNELRMRGGWKSFLLTCRERWRRIGGRSNGSDDFREASGT